MSIARDIANGTFTPQSTVGDLSETDRQMPLSRLSRLLPYHTHVDVSAACGILNRLKVRAKADDRIWIPLFHKDAGLFFYPLLKT